MGQGLAVLVTLTGAVVMTGWFLDIDALKTRPSGTG